MSDDLVVSYADDILVRVRHNHELRLELTRQGPQGPQGEKGDRGFTGKSAYELAVEQGFSGNLGDWLESLKGKPVQLRRSGSYVQWRLVGESTWQNLFPLLDIKGDKGDPGDEVELRVNSGQIQWRRGDEAWQNLIAILDLKGDPGEPVSLQTNATHIQWRLGSGAWQDLLPLTAIRGEDGDEIELRRGGDYVQWRLGTGSWTNLIPLADLKGDKGDEVELRVTATHIQWRLEGGTWQDLIALSALQGPVGNNAWSPILAVEQDDERFVLRVVDWTGGTGAKPETGLYIGATGYVTNKADAANVRGAPGSGDMTKLVYDSNNDGKVNSADRADAVDWSGVENKPSTFPPASHTHSASDITSGTLNASRIPNLAISKITNLQSALDAKLDASKVGVANGVASLDENGKVPAAQLPSYVDDVLEFPDYASLPATGESGKIYVLQTPHTVGGMTSSQFRWTGSGYAPIVASPGTTDSLSEGSTNKYFTEARVRSTQLAGLSTGSGGAIGASDTVLSAFGKIQNQINSLSSGVSNHTHPDATTSASGFMSGGDKSKLNGIEAGADKTDAENVGAAIHGSPAKTTPADSDTVALIDSAASYVLKKLSWSNIKATLKAYFDTLYSAASHTHAAATTSAAGFMSSSDKSKLDGIQAQATKNDTDANLKNRANHTGTQPISTISGLQGALDSKLDLAGGTMTGRLEIPAASADGAMLNVGLGTEGPSSPVTGDVWISGNVLYFRGTSSTRALGSTGNLSTVSQSEAEAGTATSTRAWTAQRVNQAIQALSPVKSVNSKTGEVVLDYSDVGAAAASHTHSNATTSAAGFMSASDKSKLDGIEAGAQVNAVTSVVGKTGAVTLSASDISGLGNAATRNVGTTSGTVAAGDDSRITGALQRSGGTMTGALTLSGDPTSNLHAATKQYVDTNAVKKAGDTGLGGFVSTTYNLGSSNGKTIKPDPANGNYQTLTNDGNFTLQAPDDINWSSYAILIRISGSGGTCTATGFTKVYGQLRSSGNNFATIRVINTTKVLVFEEAS